MSAPLTLTAEQLTDLAGALKVLSELYINTGVSITPYGNTDIRIGDSTLSVAWDDDRSEYVIDDRNGR